MMVGYIDEYRERFGSSRSARCSKRLHVVGGIFDRVVLIALIGYPYDHFDHLSLIASRVLVMSPSQFFER